jgi:hypothetical protein
MMVNKRIDELVNKQVNKQMWGLGLAMAAGFSCFSGLVMAQDAAKTGAVTAVNTTPISHLVEAGDTLWKISERYYGKALQWQEISRDNRIAEPRQLQLGTVLLLRASGNTASVMAVTGEVRLMTPIVNAVKRAVSMTGRVLGGLADGLAGSLSDKAPAVTMVAGALVSKGASVPVGSTLKTGPDSFITLLLPNGSRATLPSNSQVTLVSFRDGKGQPSVLLDLSAGQVDARVQPSDDPSGRSSYRVRTRLATLGARGTYFRVALPQLSGQSGIGKGDGALVGVLEGKVAVNWGVEGTLSDKSQVGKPSAALLAVGQGSVLKQGGAGRAAVVQNLLPAPVLQDAGAPQNQADVRVRWLPVPGAAAYRVQVGRDADFNDLIAQQDVAARAALENVPPPATSPEVYSAWFAKLDKGAYFVRVSAVAADGLEGFFALAGFSRQSYALSGAVAMAANDEALEFSWTQLPSSSYQLELAQDAEFAQVVLRVPDLRGHAVRVAALAPGVYFWRVRAQVQEQGQSTTVVSKIMPMLVGGAR